MGMSNTEDSVTVTFGLYKRGWWGGRRSGTIVAESLRIFAAGLSRYGRSSRLF